MRMTDNHGLMPRWGVTYICSIWIMMAIALWSWPFSLTLIGAAVLLIGIEIADNLFWDEWLNR